MQFQSTNQPTWKKRLLKVVNVAAQVVMVINLSYLGTLITPQAAHAASTSLSTQILSWNILGVDSNDPATVGPHQFLIQARITNTGAAPATAAHTTFAWGAGTSYLSLVSAASFPLNTIAAGASKDVFYVVKVTPPATPNTPSNDVFNKTRAFTITASSPDASDASAGQTLTIEHILSQSRNHILSSTVIPSNPLVGQPFTVHVEYETSSTYLDITPQMVYNPAAATLDSVVTNYVTDGGIETDIYSQNHGNVVHSDFHFRAQSAGSLNFFYTVLDHSGSSYHYNADSSDAIIVPVQPQPALTKSVNKTVANPGDALSYTINYANTGNVDLQNVVLTETYSSWFNYGSATPAPTSGNNTWNVGTLAVGASGSITINGTLKTGFPDGMTTVHNVVTMASKILNFNGQLETQPTLTATADTKVSAVCTLTITKSVDKATANPGDTLTYTMHYENTGTANCTGGGVRINDVVPSGVTYVNGSATPSALDQPSDTGQTNNLKFGYIYADFGFPANPTGFNGSLLSWNAHVVAPGESGTVTWQATVNPVAVCTTKNIDNTASIYADQIPDGITSNSVRTVVTVPCNGNLQVNKEFDDNGDGQVDRTNPQDWTWDLQGGSQNNLGGASLSLPAGAYAVTEDALNGYTSTWTCSNQTAGAGTSINLSLASEQNLTCTFRNTRDTGTITVHKNVDTNGDGLVDETNVSTWTWDILGGTQNIATGQTKTLVTGNYTISEDQKANYHVIGLVCNGVDLGATESTTINLTKGASIDCTFTNSRDTGTLIVYKQVQNTHGGDALASDFQIHVKHNGVDVGNSPAAGNSTVGTTYVLPTGSYSISEDTLPNGYIQAGIICGTQPTDTATVTFNQTIVCTVYNTDVAPTITLIKNVVNNNGGTADANDFGLTIGAVPAVSGVAYEVLANTPYALNESGLTGYQFVSLTGAGCPAQLGGTVTLNEGDHITCTITNDDIAPQLTVIKHVINNNGRTNVAADFTMNVTGTNVSDDSFSGDESGTTVTLDAGAYSVDEEAFAGYAKTLGDNCSGTIAVGEHKTCTITNDDIVTDLSVTKTDNDETANPGDTQTYVIHYANEGADVAHDVVVTDTLPNYVSYVDGSASIVPAVVTPTSLQWNIGTLNPGDNGDITFQVVIDNPMPVGSTDLVNNVVITTSSVEQNTDNNADDDTTTVFADFGVTIEKTGPATAEPGDEITYTLSWSVTGNAFVDSLVIKDPLPANTTFVAASNGGTVIAGAATWTLVAGPYKAGDNGSVTLTVKLADVLYDGTVITNTAEVCGFAQTQNQEVNELVKQCDEDTTTTTVDSDFTVQIEKTGPATAEVGDQITYTLSYLVMGNTPVDMLAITDTLPANTTFVSASNGGTYDSNTNLVTWDLGAAMPGDFGNVTLTVTLGEVDAGTVITNTGEICGTVVEAPSVIQSEPIVRCDDDTTTTEVIEPVLTLDKVVVDEPIFYNPGDTVTYQVTVTNTGTAVAHDLVLTDTLPAGFTFAGTNSDTKIFVLGDLSPNASTVVTYEVVIGSSVIAGFYDNLAQLTADNHDPLEDSETVEVRVPQVLGTEPKLVIEKTVNVAFANPGDTIAYTVIVKNIGEGAAIDVILKDVLPDGFTFADTGTKTKLWTLGNLQPNQSITITYDVVVGKTVAAGLYDNLAIASAENHKPVTDTAMVEVRAGAVLAATGIGLIDYLLFALGAAILAAGLWLTLRRSNDGSQTA